MVISRRQGLCLQFLGTILNGLLLVLITDRPGQQPKTQVCMVFEGASGPGRMGQGQKLSNPLVQWFSLSGKEPCKIRKWGERHRGSEEDSLGLGPPFMECRGWGGGWKSRPQIAAGYKCMLQNLTWLLPITQIFLNLLQKAIWSTQLGLQRKLAKNKTKQNKIMISFTFPNKAYNGLTAWIFFLSWALARERLLETEFRQQMARLQERSMPPVVLQSWKMMSWMPFWRNQGMLPGIGAKALPLGWVE